MANEIYGNLKGIRNSVIEELKTFYDIRLEGGQLLTSELALRMADVTDFINREVSVYVARNGQVLAVSVGNDQSVELPPVERCALRAYPSQRQSAAERCGYFRAEE